MVIILPWFVISQRRVPSEGSHWFELLPSPYLIVSKFSSPYDIRTYSPKESSLKKSTRGPIGLNGLFHLVLFPKGEFLKEFSEGSHWLEWLSLPCLIVSKFSPPTTFALIPQRRVPSRTLRGVPLVWMAFFTLSYCFKIFLPLRHSHLFPKGEFLKELSEGSHWLECSHYLVYSPKESSLELPWGSHCLGTLFLTLLAFWFSPPPTTHSKSPLLIPQRRVP